MSVKEEQIATTSIKDELNGKIIEKESEGKGKEELQYGKKIFDQVLEDYESLTFEQRRQLS